MAARSTRQKIRDQAAKMVSSCDDIAFHMRNLSDLADGGSEVVDTYTPLIIELQDLFLATLSEFRNKL